MLYKTYNVDAMLLHQNENSLSVTDLISIIQRFGMWNIKFMNCNWTI